MASPCSPLESKKAKSKTEGKNVFEFVPEEWKNLNEKEIQDIPPGEKTISYYLNTSKKHWRGAALHEKVGTGI